MKICVVDAGSAVTKASIYENGIMIQNIRKEIKLKRDLIEFNKFSDESLKKLYDFVEDLIKISDYVYILGAGAYRALPENELNQIINKLTSCNKVEFKLLTQSDELKYTVAGTLNEYTRQKDCVVYISGGSSVELALIQENKIINSNLNKFGGGDLASLFPDITEENVQTSLFELSKRIKEMLYYDLGETDLLILAGGDHISSFNSIYDIEISDYIVEKEIMMELCEKLYYLTLKELKMLSKTDNLSWIVGLRSRLAFILVLLEKTNAKEVLITSASTTYGYYEVQRKK